MGESYIVMTFKDSGGRRQALVGVDQESRKFVLLDPKSIDIQPSSGEAMMVRIDDHLICILDVPQNSKFDVYDDNLIITAWVQMVDPARAAPIVVKAIDAVMRMK